MLLLPMLLLAGLAGATAVDAPQQAARDFQKLDVCQMIPGSVVARAIGGTLVNTRLFQDKSFSRCTYFVKPEGATEQLGYVVWVGPATDFEELKRYIEEKKTPLTGLGDGAYTFQDKGDGRFKINVLKRGDVTLEITGESAANARKVADAVVAHLWKKSP
jgi:hypothetical protein